MYYIYFKALLFYALCKYSTKITFNIYVRNSCWTLQATCLHINLIITILEFGQQLFDNIFYDKQNIMCSKIGYFNYLTKRHAV